MLTARGADIEGIAARFGWTPLHYAAFNGQTAVVEGLIAKGAHIGARDRFGRTALDLATRYGAAKHCAYGPYSRGAEGAAVRLNNGGAAPSSLKMGLVGICSAALRDK